MQSPQDVWLRRLVGFGLFGVALWFFANLYEEVVLMPNFLTDAPAKREAWLRFFTEVTQVPFYLPVVPLAVLAVGVAWWRARRDLPMLAASLRGAALAALAGIALSAYIIPVINLRLFRPGPLDPAAVRPLAVQWLALNALRLVFTAIAAWKLLGVSQRLSK